MKGLRPTATENYLRSLVRARRAAKLSPEQVAAQIVASAHAEAFPSARLQEWEGLTSWHDWPRASTRTSAEEVLKRCGAEADGGHWEGGLYASGRDMRHLPAVPPELVSASVASVAVGDQEIPPPLEAPREKSDEEFFKDWEPLPTMKAGE